MGAKFAPSVAGLFMSQWEEEVVFTDPPEELRLYKRYIDDIFIIWVGDRDLLTSFFLKLNNNIKNIVLTWQIEEQSISFLDLEISRINNQYTTKTFFKNVDRNSYLPLSSCHHSNWLFNIPKGQLMRLRRNCTLEEDFYMQARMIGERFTSKGYDQEFIKDKIVEVGQMQRKELLEDKTPMCQQDQVPLVFDYNFQHKKIESIISRHWHILKSDTGLREVLPDRPKFIYKRAPTLRDRLVKSVIDPPKKQFSFFTGKGFYPCKRCYACTRTKRPNEKVFSFKSNSNGTQYDVNEFIGCNTEGAVYVLECSCGLQYVGRTKRLLRIRIKEHVQNIQKGFDKHNVSRHFDKYHKRDPSHLKFWGIVPYARPWRGGHKVRILSQLESKWIFSMDTLVPKGLNIEFDVNCFLSDF